MTLVTARSWPVVQRDNEYTAIQDALVNKTGTCGIVIIGDAGVGKTTLARLVTRALPTPVHWVAGTESARSIPLGVFAPLVGAAASGEPIAFLATAREALLSEGHSVIGVDDAHLLDQLSATLLHQLALDGSVRIVATVRAGESVPDAITSLWKDGYLHQSTTRDTSVSRLNSLRYICVGSRGSLRRSSSTRTVSGPGSSLRSSRGHLFPVR
jgi:AAA ATPase domain